MAEETTPRRSQRSSSNERTRRRKKRSHVGRTIGRVVGTLVLIGLITSALLACFAAVYIKNVIMPDASLDLDWFNMDLSTTLYYEDRGTGDYQELSTLHGTENRIWVEFDQIPEDLKNAAVAIEDKRFYKHGGVDWLRTANGMLRMFTGGDIQGGSTITQQLIKNLTGNDEVTVKRKILEIFRALELDGKYDKDTILEWYLNVIFLGSGCNGVYTASQKYFGKDVSQLSLAECASLIGITNNPSKYSPLSPLKVTLEDGTVKTAIDYNKERQETILNAMLEQGYITQEEHDAAVAEELHFNFDNTGDSGEDTSDVYSWYEEQVISDVCDDLVEQLKISEELASQMVFYGGLKIYTCIDPEVQAEVDKVYSNLDNLPYKSSDGQQMQSAITVIDNETGNIVALSGGMGEKKGSRTWNRATQTTRQPGSSIKPLAVYAPAMEMGLISPGTTVDDYPYQLMNGKAWPVNSYGYYKGLISIYEAVQDSSNTTAVRVLGDNVSVGASFEFLQERFHLSTLVADGDVNDMGLAQLALGGLTDGVTTREMAAAFETFANGGVYTESRTYTKVVDNEGNVLLDNTADSEVVLKDTTAFYMNYMLQGVVSGGTGTGARINGMTVAGKTGTTTRNYDRWFVGYTPYYTAAVWTGYDQNAKMRTNGNPSVSLWKKVMEPIHEGLENKKFSQPNSIVSLSYCIDCGKLPTDACKADPRGSRVTTGYFIRGEDAPTEYCTCHVTTEVCTADPILDASGAVVSYHLAGEHCPAETRKAVVRVDYTRTPIGGAVARDESALLENLQAQGTCTIHTEGYVEPTEPVDPTGPVDPTLPPEPTGTASPPPTGNPTTPPVETNGPPAVDPNQP